MQYSHDYLSKQSNRAPLIPRRMGIPPSDPNAEKQSCLLRVPQERLRRALHGPG